MVQPSVVARFLGATMDEYKKNEKFPATNVYMSAHLTRTLKSNTCKLLLTLTIQRSRLL